jgi:radical SAM superfamily enzyme YgiQ (UPF0313 family)
MRICLVHPAGSNWIAGKKDLAALANRMVPLGLLSLSAYLKRANHQVFLHDCLGPHPIAGLDANAKAILVHRPELVGFSTTTSSFLDGAALAGRIRQADPGVKILFGGVHASALGAELLTGFKDIDFLCQGEGEETLAELAAGRDLPSIDGLVWRDGERIVTNSARTPLADLDDLPFPDYEGLAGFPRGYHLPLFSYVHTPGATMVTSRGCPYQCSYCDRSVFRRSYRYNSAEYVYAHMKHLRKRFGVRHINIYDDLFTAHRPRIERLCELLTAGPLDLRFNCAVRVGQTDDELLKLLKSAGCLMVSLGIESADPELLRRHKSGVGLDAVRETVSRIQAVGLRAKGLFMMGLPGETEESIRTTGDFVLSLGLDDMNMAKFTPFPGAPLWQTIHEEGLLVNDWRLMNCLNFVFVPKGVASRERLDELYNTFVKRFYSDRRWRRKVARRFWQHRWSLWRLLCHAPSFLAARRDFEPEKTS